jgi:hypothetical protein
MKNSTAKRLKQVPAIIHGGPGAPGFTGTVARELASDWGIMEPLQTVTSLERQMRELQKLPGCVFPPRVEKTYDRSFARLIAVLADKGGRRG